MKTMTSKFPGTCELCGAKFPAGTQIVYNGRASHVECVQAEAEKQAAADREEYAFQAKSMAEFKAGARISSDLVTLSTGQELIIRNAPSYEMAKAEAFAFIASIRAAGGAAVVLYTSKRAGKRYLGREVRSGGYNGTMTYHEGWAFPCRVDVAA